MARILHVCVRPEKGAADAEHRSFQRGLGVPVHALDRLDLIDTPLTDAHLRGYAGFVVGGSPFNVTDPQKSQLQRRVEADLDKIAVRAAEGETTALFTCYGIGVVTRLLGGTVGTAHPEPARATEIRTTAEAAGDPLFSAAPATFSAFVAHKESTTALPPGGVLLATGTTCPVQAYRAGKALYATQFHPEPSPEDFAARMAFYRSGGYFAPEAYDRTRAEVLAAVVTEPALLLRRFAANLAGGSSGRG